MQIDWFRMAGLLRVNFEDRGGRGGGFPVGECVDEPAVREGDIADLLAVEERAATGRLAREPLKIPRGDPEPRIQRAA